MATDGSYYVDTTATEGAVSALQDTATTVGRADSYLQGMATLPAPAKGDGIGTALTAFKSSWHEALPEVQKELTNLAQNVDTTKTVVVTAERVVHDSFTRFAN